MKEYLISLMICALAASVVCFMSPSDTLARHQKFVVGLCIVCVSIKPTVRVIEFIRDFDVKFYISETSSEKYSDMWDEYLNDYGEEAIRDYIVNELKETFGVEAVKINIKFDGQGEGASVGQIYIELPSNAIFKDTAKMQVYFEKIFSCRVVVAIN
ncbi:MAG: hypothetical protein E7667_05070 [Ruminococcaceae bacterium]|nr:hypothetical protein [Oscillospiraceae bacterium]